MLKKINWKYALGEILLLFIGITIAIWFNNWNESKKAREVEIKSLIELKSAIDLDLRDIGENIEGFTNRVRLYRMIIKHIENELPLNEDLKNNFSQLQGKTTFLSNIGPYETLKSRGLEIITNDNVRKKISIYYDLEYEKIKTSEMQHHDHFNEYLKPVILEHFNMSSTNFYLQPIDYGQLMKNFEFKQTIHWALRTNRFMLESYTIMENTGKQLLKDLSEEIELLK